MRKNSPHKEMYSPLVDPMLDKKKKKNFKYNC